MNNKIKIFGITLFAVLALAALGAGVAFAQSSTPNAGFGWMMGGNGQTGYGSGMMGGRGGMMSGYDSGSMSAMHEWMNASGGMRTYVWNALAEKLDLTSDELIAEVNRGKMIAQIAEEKGVSSIDLVAALETAHQESLAHAVTDGTLTQEQADSLLAQMSGRYEWILDNMDSGGMMSGQYGAGGIMNGWGGAGSCHGNLNSNPTDAQPKP